MAPPRRYGHPKPNPITNAKTTMKRPAMAAPIHPHATVRSAIVSSITAAPAFVRLEVDSSGMRTEEPHKKAAGRQERGLAGADSAAKFACTPRPAHHIMLACAGFSDGPEGKRRTDARAFAPGGARRRRRPAAPAPRVGPHDGARARRIFARSRLFHRARQIQDPSLRGLR